MVANSELSSLFNAGLSDLQLRLRHSGAAKNSWKFDHFIETFGSRGPNEWEHVKHGGQTHRSFNTHRRMRLTDAKILLQFVSRTVKSRNNNTQLLART